MRGRPCTSRCSPGTTTSCSPSTPSGVRIVSRTDCLDSEDRHAIPPQSEKEVCYATYYDFSATIPASAQAPFPDFWGGPSKRCFFYDTSELTQSPNSHHSIIHVYKDAYDVTDPSFGPFTCRGGPHDGESCNPQGIGQPAPDGADCGEPRPSTAIPRSSPSIRRSRSTAPTSPAAPMEASAAFYRRLGMEIEDSGPDHRTATNAGAFDFDLDSRSFAKTWNSATPDTPGMPSVVIGFGVASREEVDRLYAELTAAGYRGQQRPYDAFWGARYAVVEDPDGNPVGLMSPSDPGAVAGRPSPYQKRGRRRPAKSAIRLPRDALAARLRTTRLWYWRLVRSRPWGLVGGECSEEAHYPR